MKSKHAIIVVVGLILVVAAGVWGSTSQSADKVWEVTATKENTFVVKGEKKPMITVKAGQPVKLRITGEKGKEWAKDGSVHSFISEAGQDMLGALVDYITEIAPPAP